MAGRRAGPAGSAREARPAQGQPPRDPNAPGAPVVIGKGSISGTVTVAGSGQPARRARVNLSGGNEVGGSRSTTTDEHGPVRVQCASRGRFSLSASKPGHISGSYGQRQPGTAGHADSARRRPASPGAIADHSRWRDHRHRARRERRGASRHAGPRASLRHAERSADAAIGRERFHRRPRRLSHLRSAARRVLVYATPRNTTTRASKAVRPSCSSSCGNQK